MSQKCMQNILGWCLMCTDHAIFFAGAHPVKLTYTDVSVNLQRQHELHLLALLLLLALDVLLLTSPSITCCSAFLGSACFSHLCCMMAIASVPLL